MSAKQNMTRALVLFFSLSFILLAVGCTDNKQLKQDMLQAVGKQEQITSYRFNGAIELKVDSSMLGQANPIAIALFTMLKDSKFEYSGLSALEPSRMEAQIKVTPTGGSATDIPILIKDSKLYFHMPPLNKADEYMVLPIEAPSATTSAAGANQLEPLKNTGHLTAELSKKVLESVDPQWLDSPKEAVTFPDGTTAKKITLNVTKKNEQAFSDNWNAALPGLVDLLRTNGMALGTTADMWVSALKKIKIQAPTTIEILIDSQGFIREQKWNLTFTSGGSTNENKLNWTQTLSEVNQNPAFTKEIPTKVKSLDELLRLIKPAPAAQK